MMNLKPASIAIAAALATAGGTAFALPVSDYNSTAGDTVDLYISGATAQEVGLRNTIARLCVAGSLDIYQFSNQQAAFCTINKTVVTGITPASVTKMVVYKSGVGGSGNGVGPVADAGQLVFIDMAALKANSALVTGPSTTVAAVAPTAPDTIGIPAFTRTTVDTSATANVITEAGFSDVEPKLLGASSAQVVKLNIRAPNVLTMGMPVTISAYRKLQAAQGLGSDDTEANMPSLRLAVLRSIFTGNITKWSQLGLTGGNALTDDNIHLATRVESSGTQKSFNVNITGAACTAGVQAILANNATGASDCTAATLTGQNVFAGSGSGDVTTCLAGHDANSRGAFGVLSMEFVPGTTSGGDGYRHIKIDGYAPTLVNVVNGRYNHWVEPTFQYRKSGGALAGNKKTIADRIYLQLGAEAVITSLNNAFVQPFGTRSGILAKPTASNLPESVTPTEATATAVLANPTAAFTRSLSGSPINCQQPALFN